MCLVGKLFVRNKKTRMTWCRAKGGRERRELWLSFAFSSESMETSGFPFEAGMVDPYSGASSLFSLCFCFWVLFVPLLHQVTLLSYNSSTLEWLPVFWNPAAPANYRQLFRQNSFTKVPMGYRSASMFIGLVQRFSTTVPQNS